MARDFVTELLSEAEAPSDLRPAGEYFSRGPALPAGVTERTVYVALDGSEHSSVRGAVEKNDRFARTERANAMLNDGATVWEAAREWSWMEDPKLPEIFRKITKDTPLIISHWQCRDTPGYKVSLFEDDGYYIFVGGDAGSWSGPYGRKVSPSELARYAEDTLRKHPELAAQAIEVRRTETQSGSDCESAVVRGDDAP